MINSDARPVNRAQPAYLAVAGDASSPVAAGPTPTPTPEPAVDVVTRSETFNWQPQDPQVMAPSTKTLGGVYQNADSKPCTDKVKLNFPLERDNGRFVYANNDPRQIQSIAFANAANTVDVMGKVFGMTKWAFANPQLAVNADSGQMLNAYYKREMGAVNGFHAPDKVLGRTVYTFGSGDVLPHEVGHAILDAIRPSYLGTFSGDVAAFHESFGDLVAIHMALMDDRVVKRVVVQTGGDLSKPNIAAEIAEELGMAVNHESGSQVTGGDYLRNALNNFQWADPASLPNKGGPTQLGRESHSFSRLWTGAHYDVLEALVKQRTDAGQEPAAAIKEANLELLGMLGNMMKDAPQGSFTFRDMAQNFIASDQKYAEGKHVDLIRQVMVDRKILSADSPALPAATRSLFMSNETTDSNSPPTIQVPFSLDDSFGLLAGAKVEIPVDSRTAIFQSQDAVDDSMSSIRLLAQDGRIKITQKGEAFDPNTDYLSPTGEVYVGALVWDGDQKKLVRLTVVD